MTKLTKDNPEKMEFIDVSGLPVNTIHANNYMFFEELNDVIQREPVDFISPELRGILSSIGMEKGKSFSPDERLKNILTDSVAVANGTARSLAFSPREKDAYIYKDSYWQTAFVGNDYRWLKDKGMGGRYLDARTLYFYLATVNTPAMQAKIPCVVTNVGGMPHMLAHGDGGWIVPPKDPLALQIAISKSLVQNQSQIKTTFAYERVMHEFNYLHMSRRYISEYKSVLTAASLAM